VTELITNVDLIKAQIRIASGEKWKTRRARSYSPAMQSNAGSTPKIQ